jgi:hypothetical protein
MANIDEDKSNVAPTQGLTPEAQASMVSDQFKSSKNTVTSGWTEAADKAFAKQVNAYNSKQDQESQAKFEQFKQSNPQSYRQTMVDWLSENKNHPEAAEVQKKIDAIKPDKGALAAEQKRQKQKADADVARETERGRVESQQPGKEATKRAQAKAVEDYKNGILWSSGRPRS